MSALYNTVGKQVSCDGCLKFGERRFWSPDSAKFAGKWVSVRLPGPDDQMVTFWDGDADTARKYAAHLLADTGFVAPQGLAEAARAAREQARVRRSSVVRLQAELLIQLVHDRDDHPRLGFIAILVSKYRHHAQLLKDLLGVSRNKLIEGEAHGDLKRSERFEARLRLAERIFEIGQVGFGSHIASPAADARDASEAQAGAHRLCGDGK
jgi:hypothetical protein